MANVNCRTDTLVRQNVRTWWCRFGNVLLQLFSSRFHSNCWLRTHLCKPLHATVESVRTEWNLLWTYINQTFFTRAFMHTYIYIYIYLLKNVKDIVILRLPLILLDFISPRSEYSTEELDRFNSTQVPTTDFAMTLCKLWISFVASFLQSLDCIGRRLCCFLEVTLKFEILQGYIDPEWE